MRASCAPRATTPVRLRDRRLPQHATHTTKPGTWMLVRSSNGARIKPGQTDETQRWKTRTRSQGEGDKGK